MHPIFSFPRRNWCLVLAGLFFFALAFDYPASGAKKKSSKKKTTGTATEVEEGSDVSEEVTDPASGVSDEPAAEPAKSRKSRSTKGPKKPSSSRSKKSKKGSVEEQAAAPTETFYENAWRKFEIGSAKERKEVISELKELVKKDPGDGTGNYYLGIMLAEEQSYNPAEEHFRAAAAAFPQSADILFRLSEVLIARRKDDEAVSTLKQAEALDPNHPGVKKMLGIRALADEKFDEAIQLLSKAREGYPDNRDVLRCLGSALAAKGKFSEAVPLLTLVLSLDDMDPEIHLILGKCYQEMGKVKEAAAEMEKAKAQGRKETEISKLVGYDLARALYDTGKTEEAIREYQKTIKSDPDPATGWFELGKIHEDLGDTEEALKAYKKAFEFDGKKGDAVFRVAALLRGSGKFDDAIAALELIVKKKDWSDSASQEIADIKAERDEEKRDGLLEMAQGGTEENREKAYFKMLEMDKKDQTALEGLKQLAYEQGDLDKVSYYIKELKKAGHLTKEQADIQLNELTYRIDAGEDLQTWETRFEEYRSHEEWDKALAMNKKLKEYAQAQLESWKKAPTGTPEKRAVKAEMIKLTKIRIRLLNETTRDLQAAKKRSK